MRIGASGGSLSVGCSLQKQAAQSLPTGNNLVVEFDLVISDPYGYYDAVNHGILPTVAGWYWCHSSLRIVGMTAAKTMGLFFLRDSGNVGGITMTTGAAGDLDIEHNKIVYLDGTQLLQVLVIQTNTDTRSLTAGSYLDCYLFRRGA